MRLAVRLSDDTAGNSAVCVDANDQLQAVRPHGAHEAVGIAAGDEAELVLGYGAGFRQRGPLARYLPDLACVQRHPRGRHSVGRKPSIDR